MECVLHWDKTAWPELSLVAYLPMPWWLLDCRSDTKPWGPRLRRFCMCLASLAKKTQKGRCLEIDRLAWPVLSPCCDQTQRMSQLTGASRGSGISGDFTMIRSNMVQVNPEWNVMAWLSMTAIADRENQPPSSGHVVWKVDLGLSTWGFGVKSKTRADRQSEQGSAQMPSSKDVRTPHPFQRSVAFIYVLCQISIWQEKRQCFLFFSWRYFDNAQYLDWCTSWPSQLVLSMA